MKRTSASTTVLRRAVRFDQASAVRAAVLGLLIAGLLWTVARMGYSAEPPRDHASASENRSFLRPNEAIDRELFTPSSPASSSPSPGAKSETSGKEVGSADSAVDAATVVEQMLQAASRLGSRDSGPETQRLQQRILEALAKIAEQAAKAPAPSPTAEPRPTSSAPLGSAVDKSDGDQKTGKTKPGAQPKSGQAPGAAPNVQGQPETAANRESLLRRVWGDLPLRQRDEILQFQPPEEFLPQYEIEIEAYFRRLAESGRNWREESKDKPATGSQNEKGAK